MGVGGVITNGGQNWAWRRLYNKGGGASNYVAKLKISTGTTTPAVTDTDMEDTVLETKSPIGGTPIFDTTNKRVEIRYFISATECNGSSITEYGEFLDDLTTMYSHDVATAVSKNDQTEVTVIVVHDSVPG